MAKRHREPRTELAILRDLCRAQDKLLVCYRLGDPNGGRYADRCRWLRDELEGRQALDESGRTCGGPKAKVE